MSENSKKLVSLLEIPEGSTCVLTGWGALLAHDIRKLTDVGILLDLPLIVMKVTSSGPVVIAINDAHVAIDAKTAREMRVYLKED